MMYYHVYSMFNFKVCTNIKCQNLEMVPIRTDGLGELIDCDSNSVITTPDR